MIKKTTSGYSKIPRSTRYLFGNELAERWSVYGMKGLLVLQVFASWRRDAVSVGVLVTVCGSRVRWVGLIELTFAKV